MKLSTKVIAALSAVFLLTACENGPGGSSTGADGQTYGSDYNGPMGTQEHLAAAVGDRVFYAYDSSALSSEAQRTLERQAAWLQQYGDVSVTIEGHCDERGTREYNLALGERRANAAKKYLVSLGVAPARVSTISYGKERPAVIGSNESAWAQNRRAVTVVVNR